MPAQEFRSTLSGRVTDGSGASIPAVRISAVSTETGSRFQTQSGQEGLYVLPFLAPGSYHVSAEQDGFKTYKQDGIQIGTNTRVTVDIRLELGSQAESVTVTADAALLTTATASVGQVITSAQIENMPLNGRSPLSLAQLAYGVVPTSDPRLARPFDNNQTSQFSMGGGQTQSNELLLDGSPDMSRSRRVAYSPPMDAVTEVKIEAFQADAAYGNTAGGTVNVVTKSGTNEFHGSAYEFNQVSALKATPFFTNAAGQKKPVTRFNQFGVTLGGPVSIPKLYDGRNRLFFFFGYEGIRQSEPEPLFSTVPTAEQRTGDFSKLLNVSGAYQLYDPLTGIGEGNRIRRQSIPGNVIPADRISPVARRVLEFYPLPNQPGTADGRQNYFSNTVRSDTFSSYLGRLDANLSDRHKLFWNMRTNHRLESRGNRFNNIATGNFLTRENWGSSFDDVYTFTPTLLLNTRLSWNRYIDANTRPSTGFDFASLGLPESLRASSTRLVLPIFNFGEYQDIGNSGGDSTPFDTYQIFTTLTKVAGRQSFKFGADLRRQVESSNNFGNSSGTYDFNSAWTRGPLDNSPEAPIGQDLAAFLLGFPTGGNFQVNATRTQSAHYFAFFVQDDVRLRQHLTINAGLRYEKETGTTERFDRTVSGFDYGAANRVTEAARRAYAANPNSLLPISNFNPAGGLTFAGPDRRQVYSTYSHAIAPRLGITWSPAALGTNTVIRAGGGLFYAGIGTTGIQQPGFSQTTPLAANVNNFLRPVLSLANPYPNGILQPDGASLGVNTFLGQNVTFTQPVFGQPYTWRWNFNIQRQIGSDAVVEVGYLGSRSAKLTENRDLNFVPLNLLSRSPVRDQATIDRLTAVVPNPFAGLLPGTSLNGATTTLEQLVRPYPQFPGQAGVRVEGLSHGISRFHMLQVRAEKRLASGFQLLANFQWSKMLEATERLNAADPVLHYRIANEDRSYRLVLSGSYDLPFGRGKALGASAGPWLNRLIGGWRLNGIYIVQPGAPVEWGNVLYLGGDLNWEARNLERTFDVTRFNQNPREQLDRNVRTFSRAFPGYRGHGVNNLDASVFKEVPITERLQAQLRLEAFNAFNRTQFNAPELSPTNTNFGRITSAANLPRSLQLALRLRW